MVLAPVASRSLHFTFSGKPLGASDVHANNHAQKSRLVVIEGCQVKSHQSESTLSYIFPKQE